MQENKLVTNLLSAFQIVIYRIDIDKLLLSLVFPKTVTKFLAVVRSFHVFMKWSGVIMCKCQAKQAVSVNTLMALFDELIVY